MAVNERKISDKVEVKETRMSEKDDDGREVASKTHEDVAKADAESTGESGSAQERNKED